MYIYSYLNAIQKFTPLAVWTVESRVKPVLVMSKPEATAGEVITPVEPVVNMLSVV
jgi:hypothetical protein